MLVLGALAALLAVTLVNEPLRLWLRSLWLLPAIGVRLMINIRYHVISLVAVFLALAIGVVAGSTVVQRSVVDNLKSTQGHIEKNLDDLEAKNADAPGSGVRVGGPFRHALATGSGGLPDRRARPAPTSWSCGRRARPTTRWAGCATA